MLSTTGSDLDYFRVFVYALFELVGQKMFETYDLVTRNPLVCRLVRKSKRSWRERTSYQANASQKFRKTKTSSKPPLEPCPVEEDDYELPVDAPYKPAAQEYRVLTEKAKLESLEKELVTLRKVMAQFVQQHEQRNQTQKSLDITVVEEKHKHVYTTTTKKEEFEEHVGDSAS
ncbi:uncharacterized protein LOC126314454 isoform X2 [Schistocerca gregaria]|uniref:uncharacterized protein LOC126314454 isoform X2 n=1 Tax=Schistocerca gregaria TaxID=7010 RepID=UPI00211F406A|nr:uncharacterized protein LOC126314454 isoform X2 [Schistocerca gregaria]